MKFFPLSLIACATLFAGTNTLISLSAKQIVTMGISTGQLIKTDVASQANLPAMVVTPPAQMSLATSMQEGIIEKTFVSVGDNVKAGQPLAIVASSSGVITQREYIQLENKLRKAKTIAQKDQTLLHEGIISGREAARSQQEVELLEAELDEKRSLLKMMGITLPKASGNTLSSKSVISSPSSGVVIEQTAILGQKIDAMTPLFKVANLSTLWLDIQTPMTTARLVSVGDSVRTSLGAYGKVIKIAKGVDPKNQSVIIRAKITQGENLLYPGQFVQAAISTPLKQGITIPKSGLIRQGSESYIFVKTPQGFIAKNVHVIKEECTTFIISGDLTGHEEVAVSGIVSLKGLLAQKDEGTPQ